MKHCASAVSKMVGCRLDIWDFILGRTIGNICLHQYKLLLWPANHLSSGYRGLKLEADHVPPSYAICKNACTFIFTFHIITLLQGVKHWSDTIFTFSLYAVGLLFTHVAFPEAGKIWNFSSFPSSSYFSVWTRPGLPGRLMRLKISPTIFTLVFEHLSSV